VPKPGVTIETGPFVAATTSEDLGALAAQLRDGPLLKLQELQARITELTQRDAAAPSSNVEDLERLVLLSLAAMEHFHAFTRELAAAVREVTDPRVHPH
jgi:hypothetical protein